MLVVVLAGAAAARLYSTLFFHVLAEIFVVCIAGCIFVLAWNARRFQKNDFLIFIGIGFLFTGFLDLIHILAFPGMNIFPDSPDLSARLWIETLSVETATLLAAPLMLRRHGHHRAIFAGFAGVTAILLLAAFAGTFPVFYVPGEGATVSMIAAGGIVCIALVLAGVHFWLNRSTFDATVLSLLLAAIAVTALSEISLMFSVGVSDACNTLGHLLKIVAFTLIYAAIIDIGLRRPYDLIFRDLALAEAQARKERDTAQNYLDIAGVIMLALDTEGKVVMINRKGEHLLGLPQDRIVGKNWFDTFVPEADRSRARTGCRDFMAGEVRFETNENRIVTADGSSRDIRWANAVLKDDDGAPVGLLSSGSDITEENLSKEALRQASQKLALLGSITRHDTLNHLTALAGYLELAGEETGDQQKFFLDRAAAVVTRIEADLLFSAEYQRMGSSPPAWQNPETLIKSCVENLGAGKIVRIDLAPVEIYADPMLEKVFCNLIANALNHGDGVSRVVFTTDKTEDGLIIVCEDDGIGIPQGDKETIFSSGYGKNHGYGLFLIKEILAITDIRIRETGQPGSGARFEICVPKGKYRML